MNKKSLDIEIWRKKIGLLPVPLFQDKSTDKKFILLNGGIKGNLCVDFDEEEITSPRNYAWSSDVGNYLTISDKYVSVYRWGTFRNNKYRINEVASKLESFYSYLQKQNINNQDSIVKFSILLYRQIRSLLRDNYGKESLNALLYLFACVADGNIDRTKLAVNNWSLSEETKEKVLDNIPNANWDQLIEIFNAGLESKGLRPEINLLLRHASGSIFQEAHFETLFPTTFQQTLPGFLPKIEGGLHNKNRDQTSAHFTPTSIVRTIVEEAIKEFSFNGRQEITILDPACGSGEFLKEFIRQIKMSGYIGSVKIIGWDISDAAIDMANFIINYEVKPYKDLITIKLEIKDVLLGGDNWSVNADFVLMNPPFISWELMKEDQRSNVSTILGKLKSKRPNSSSAFLWNATQCLNNGGILGCVLPTSIFENETYIPLREEIKNILDVKIIGRVGSHTLFSNTLVDTAIFLGSKNKAKKQSPLVFWSDYKVESAASALREVRKIKTKNTIIAINEEGYSLYENPLLTNFENWMPIPQRSLELLTRYKTFTKVRDIFEVRQGARTGLNSAFIISKEYHNKLSIKEKKYFRPAVTNESISKGKLNESFYIFYPTSEKLPNIKSEKELNKIVPIFYKNYLLPNYKKLVNRKGIKEWWELTRPRNWQKTFVPKIVSKEFGKAGDFAFDKKGIFVAERSHAWFPKHGSVLGDLGYAYVCILSMPIINGFLTGLSKQLGGGNWWYLSSKYINNMPIPNLFDTNRYRDGIISELIDLGIQMNNGETVVTEQLIRLSKILYNDSSINS